MQSNWMMLNNSNGKRLSTEPLDEAMKELLEVCQQYKYDKSSAHQNPEQQQRDATRLNRYVADRNGPLVHKDCQRATPTMSISLNDNDKQHSYAATKCDNKTNGHLGGAFPESGSHDILATSSPKTLDHSQSGSIEKLQERQSELQRQLDEVLAVAKSLEARQKLKMSTILEDGAKSSAGKMSLDEDEDDELIEFQQIENELRISELNRQLGNIQEELRLRLYRRLLSKTSNGAKSNQKPQQNNLESSIRRSSTQTDECTPPSSSCSDEQTISSSMSASDTINSKLSTEAELIDQLERCNLTKSTAKFQPSSNKPYDQSDHKSPTTLNSSNQRNQDDPKCSPVTYEQETFQTIDLAPALQSSNHQEISKFAPKQDKFAPPGQTNPNAFLGPDAERQMFVLTNYAPNGLRNCAATNDLERIDEGEEDENEFYSNSSMFRRIYEEKLSPLFQAPENNRSQSSSGAQDRIESVSSEAGTSKACQVTGNPEVNRTPESRNQSDFRFNMSNVNSAKRGTNRPLTMYMPKPDEDIDLVELVQTMGHDLDIISDKLRLNPSSAMGYLFKSCSKKNKKWLKRFFYFDRSSKTLSYYENEDQLVKKGCTPKCVIPFDEIGDVYVDHRLSELSERQKGSKAKSFVFVLATIKRKYVLATPKAELMRAWIDILFTAAKANNYFQQLGDDDDMDHGYPADCLDF